MAEENSEVDALGKLVEAVSLAEVTPKTPDRGSSLKEPTTVQKIKIRIKRTENPINRSESDSVGVSSEAPVPDLSSIETFDAITTSTEILPTVLKSESVSVPTLAADCVPTDSVPADSIATLAVDSVPADSVVTLAADSVPADSVATLAADSVPVDSVTTLPADSVATPLYPRWLVPIDFTDLVPLVNFAFKEYFIKVAYIQIDDEIKEKSTKTKKAGEKARQTFIRFVAAINKKIWSEEAEWIYVFVVDGLIVKIGGTRTGLLKRCGSYLSGHGIPELGGNSNSTNAKIYWTFLHLLNQGKKIEMYACRLPEAIVTQTVFGSTKVIRTQCFHDWEAFCLEEFAKLYGSFPPLSNNCDPRHRKEKVQKRK